MHGRDCELGYWVFLEVKYVYFSLMNAMPWSMRSLT